MLENRILQILARSPDGMSGAEIQSSLPWWALSFFSLYLCLHRMEDEGKILSKWEDGPYPRRRVYLAKRS